jgi:hypothetical protein
MHLTNAGVHPASCPTGMTSMRFLALVAAAMLAATLALTHQAFAFTIYNSGTNPDGSPRYADPDEKLQSNLGGQGQAKGAGPARNSVSIYSGVMPGTHEVLPPPASFFKTAPPRKRMAQRPQASR